MNPCGVAGCGTAATRRGLCVKHYWRMKRNGSTDALPAAQFVPFVNPGGYLVVGAPAGHLLLVGKGNRAILQHRLVLFDAVGLGPHRCYWCGRHVNWRYPSYSPHTLTVDHLDCNKQNNAPGNLVPSCYSCNASRAMAIRLGTQFSPHSREA